MLRKSPYLCTVFFMVLDLRLTKVGLSGALFLCPYVSYAVSVPGFWCGLWRSFWQISFSGCCLCRNKMLSLQ